MLDWDLGLPGSSLTRGTALCPGARHFILCLVQVQPRKAGLDITEKMFDWDVKIQINQIIAYQFIQHVNG